MIKKRLHRGYAYHFLEHHPSLSDSHLVQIVYSRIRYNFCRPILCCIDRLFEDDAHPFASHFNQRIFYPLPRLLVGKDWATRQVLWDMYYPYLPLPSWKRRKICGIFLVYLAIRHYFIIFVAEYAAFNAVL